MAKGTRGLAAIARSVQVACLCATPLISACGNEANPATPSISAQITFTQQTPASGSTIVAPEGTPPGAFIPVSSNLLTVGVSIVSTRDVPWAQLNVYLLSGDTYCGQNLPDSPTWAPLPTGQGIAYTVRGFQVYRLPCDVTGIRAMLHTRNSGALTPPTASETVAEATVAVTYRLRQ